MDEDAPNFSYAYGGAPLTPSSASWNPALRSEKEASAPANAKPPAQPKPESLSEEEGEGEDEEDEEDDDEEEESEEEDSDDEDEDKAPSQPAVTAPLATAPSPSIKPATAEKHSNDGFTARDIVAQAEQSASQPPVQQSQEESGAGGPEKDLVNATQALNIEEQTAPAETEVNKDKGEEEEEDSEEESSDEEPSPEAHPEVNYEHQGESTVLEDAVTESVKAPLVADTEADEWGTSGDDAFDLDGQPQESALPIPAVEAVGTTVGDESIGNTTVGGNAGADIDWGNTEEEQEDFFGTIAGQQIEPAQSTDETPGAHVVQAETKAPEKSEWDLDLDLDDDFLPDKEDGPVIELSDDEGFLEDEPPAAAGQPTQSHPSGTASRYAPQSATPAAVPAASPYAPQAQSSPAATPAYDGFGRNLAYQQQQQSRPPPLSTACLNSMGKSLNLSLKPRQLTSFLSQSMASVNYDFIVPEDERAADPLERWKGYPIFTWGLGGTVVTSFPKQIPRYGGGGSAPMMKTNPGEIRLQSIKEVLPLPEDIAKFPGPLKAKSKKKDVLAWLGRKIEVLDAQSKEPALEHSMSEDDIKRLGDRVLLWKLMQILVEHDGRLEGAPAEVAIKKIFSPVKEEVPDADGSYSTGVDIVGRSRSNTSTIQAEPSDPRTLENLQNMLIQGDREKAVWHAVDQRLWGHAMLLSSTGNKDTWKRVVQEFVRKEVKNVGRNNQALAVLYEVFAGNHEEAIDELVPASARAGFQMISADGAGATQNALQGLDKWRETIALILNNRSEGDASALLSLGRLLAQYGRVEAAHICFIFARSVIKIGGIDDVQADLVLIGADHRQYPLETGIELEPILLTEVFEFAMSLSSPSVPYVLPHLQHFKLAHAYQLAENGYKTDAQAYCDSIAAIMKATTQISPYYSPAFITTLDDLSQRLSQAPKDGSSSWISKPSMDKVGSSLLSKFNSFIAGDDEADGGRPAGTESGPFANIAGGSPALTPSQSNADLYGAMSGYGIPAQPAAPANSRYAPSNAYAPRSSSEQQRSRYEPQGRPSMESNDSFGMRAASDSYTPMTPTSGILSPTQNQLSPPSARTQAKVQSYSPLRQDFSPRQASYNSPYMPMSSVEGLAASPAFGGYQPQASFDEPAQPATDEQGQGSSNTYEPPSYQPYNPDEDDKEEEEQPKKKKSFMDDDDDDDLAARASALKISGGSSSKSEADRKADEAFRKAAEEDAKRDKEAAAAKKGGWLSGWFKKDPNAGPGPIKAKLGEESSFVYDTDLGKWVNKKAGATDTAKPAATPPPPRSGPPGAARSASGSAAPAPPSSAGPPAAGALRPPVSNLRSSSLPPPLHSAGSRASTPGIAESDEEGLAGPKPPMLARPSFGAASGPPSRPGTGMSNASSIDDLLGAPQARKGPAAGKKKKGGRYVDVMAK
ncbi:hypothetical protein COCC4DRAFT_165611 [Bipolaris maydis ATCC 48331]|uniref:Protein transport protein sec16 n=2 Tax=Cochliobolus heterostrophus TaxID=5016 RepID=M2U043_COCH5|nr:uncharacterized protein COCC4DRAFT_165611 [Bipolaris maydis ATCC 48331]EMD87446.1 hypothetical protein COCHEDRAFT_1145090 [Bipolaris maydis C5]KAJ5023269.1 Sec23-binding domain of Sec16-domain-containing protein [Bipolaris maydis]ENI06646.1 hypothetical protein COCC4DRAFT_165611 [Bipolaris maydis ATCC 48331]KAJ6266939.1 Sec23-binding domain of Sec16-domain-containing protein [Bipolaris maydis]KAJ6277557.1 Sec23-binding domain of Sec16-domain-containing protein [Bipolaris maydis]